MAYVVEGSKTWRIPAWDFHVCSTLVSRHLPFMAFFLKLFLLGGWVRVLLVQSQLSWKAEILSAEVNFGCIPVSLFHLIFEIRSCSGLRAVLTGLQGHRSSCLGSYTSCITNTAGCGELSIWMLRPEFRFFCLCNHWTFHAAPVPCFLFEDHSCIVVGS